VGFRNDLDLDFEFRFPEAVELEKKMQDFLLDNAPGGYFLPEKGVDFVTSEKNLSKRFTQIDGEIQLCQKKNQQFNWHGDFVFQSEEDAETNHIPDLEKYYLSEKVRKYVLSTGTKNFYSKPETDLEVARPLLTTMHKMHRAGVDNYVTTDDSFKIVVSDTSMYQQAGNSIVVDVLIHIMEQILKSYPKLND
jgi:DNA (cytosine-5)-methyltransferase 1